MEEPMPIVPTETQRSPEPILVFGAGVLVLAMVWVVGLQTGSFLVHVAYPLGFWLAADGLRGHSGTTPLFRRPLLVGEMILVGAFLGLLLDFHMVGLVGILDLAAVTTPALALAMYVGWGLALPAAYSSYRLVLEWIAHGRSLHISPLPGWLPLALALIGLPLAASALFFRLWVGQPPGWLVVPVFLGLWILAEHLLIRRGRPGLLETLLAGDPRPLLAMVAASLPFTLLWEGLNAQMGSWFYRNLSNAIPLRTARNWARRLL